MTEFRHQSAKPERCSSGFATTIWDTVFAAGDEQASEHDASLQLLCERYWPPIYAYLRSKGHAPDEAKDLTQAFFESLLKHHTLARADPARGRFRSFLLGVLKNFLLVQRRHQAAVNRGAVQPFLSWDESAAEQWCRETLLRIETPEMAFDRRWAIDLLERVMTRFRASFQHPAGRGLLEKLEPHLWDETEAVPYETLARDMSSTAGALRATVHRMRRKYRELLRQEILATGVPAPDLNDEIRHLVQVLRG